jgi:GNAT superfamily N-acetyltransferase
MIELPPNSRGPLRPLFDGFPYTPTVVRAVLTEGFGRAWADDPDHPHVGLVELDFNFLAGDVKHPAARRAVEMVFGDLVVPSPRWQELVSDIWGVRDVRTHPRVSFKGAAFDRDALTNVMARVPDEFEIIRVERDDQLDDFTSLGPCLIGNFPSRADYLRRGLGFGIRHEGRFVSAASSFCVADNDLEFEIQTHANFRRRGLATAVAARLILHCLDHGITPHWDAHNPPSAALARKLGFGDEVEYLTFGREPG